MQTVEQKVKELRGKIVSAAWRQGAFDLGAVSAYAIQDGGRRYIYWNIDGNANPSDAQITQALGKLID